MTDLKFALRQLLKHPGFTAVAVLTLALGIGLNTAMFSFVNALLLRPLPYPDADRLARLHRDTPHGFSDQFSTADYLELRRGETGFGRFAGYNHSSFILRDSGRSLDRVRASADLFDVLGLQPVLGRSFRPEDELPGDDHVALLSYHLWQEQFGGASDVVGKTIPGNNETLEIIGVLPPAATDHRLFGQTGLFSPLSLTAGARTARDAQWINIIGRRNRTVSAGQGAAFVEAFGARLAAQLPAGDAADKWGSEPLPDSSVSPAGRLMLAMLLGLSGFVLLIACSNLANILLAKVMAGTRDFAVRTALGASRWRLISPLAFESLVLALAGGALALVVAQGTTHWLQGVIAGGGGPAFDFPMDWHVLGFALCVSVLTLAFFGLGPALFTTRIGTHEMLKGNARVTTPGRGHQRLRHLLITGQFALALVLLAGAGFFVRGSINLLKQSHGWNADNVLQGELALPSDRYPGGTEINALYRQVVERLRQIPGVRFASVSYGLPYLGLRGQGEYVVDGNPAEPGRSGLRAKINATTSTYFDVTGTPLIAGRDFDIRDTAGSPRVAIISQGMATALFGEQNAIGRRVAALGSNPSDWLEIVGVVGDVRSMDVAQPPAPYQLYQPTAQDPRPGCFIAVRTTGIAPGAALESLRATVMAIDPNLILHDLKTVDNAMTFVTSQMYLCQQLLVSFAALGLLLATLGIYGAISRMVTQRTGEFGVRMAFGAQLLDLVRLVLGSGLRIAVVGAVTGLLGALGLSRLLSAMLPALETNGSWVLAAAITLLIGVALLACWLPARRASRVDPMEALRSE